MIRRAATSFLGRQAQRLGVLGTGQLTPKQKARRALGGAAVASQAKRYSNMMQTKRSDCIAAQMANGHMPSDLTSDERAYFFGD